MDEGGGGQDGADGQDGEDGQDGFELSGADGRGGK